MLLKFFRRIKHYLIAVAAYWYYGRPSRRLIVVGVTGTKGKSTTSRLIASVLEAGGNKVGLLSTVEFQIADQRLPNNHKMTMLGLGKIQKMLRAMVRAGCIYAVVETSSEGILQYRHYGLNYDIAVFTNLGEEHAERHGGLINLKKDKGRMFAALNRRRKKIGAVKIRKVIVANLDDANSDYYLNFLADEKWGFGLRNRSEFVSDLRLVIGDVIHTAIGRAEFVVGADKYVLNLVGDFNVYNALAAVAVGRSQGLDAAQIASGFLQVQQVDGRMEFVETGQAFQVVVDYAHEPLSLTALFATLRKLIVAQKGRLIAVVGSDGGGRDVGKRGKMGEIAGLMADYVIITDVNCFDENPLVIAEMLAAGARLVGKIDGKDLWVEIDRRQAIALALRLAQPHDVVAITAKGTEPCMVVAGGRKVPWDDRRVVRELLQSLI